MPGAELDPADHAAAAALVDAARDLADRIWRSHAPPAERAAVAAELRRLAQRLEPLEEANPVVTPIGGLLPGRGHPLLPPLVRERDGHRLGSVTYTRAHAGAGQAVHGGQIALLFDEVLGGVAAAVAQSRTASITVDFRSLTPIDVPLAIEGWVDRTEGRKIFVEGRLIDGKRVCAEAHALFIAVDGWS